MRTVHLAALSLVTAAAAGCADLDDAATDTRRQPLGACGLGDEQLATRVYTTADIPSLSPLQKAQFVRAFQESAWDDITTVEEAFLHADDHELRASILRDSGTNQFYVQIDYHVGDNPYGGVLYWDTAVLGAAIHDGFPEECGPLTYAYGASDHAPECAGFLTYVNTASYGALDAYLPSNVATNLVNARPFGSIASVVAVNGIAEFRLQQLLAAARTSGHVTSACSGIFDQIGLSTADDAALVSLANEASAEELHGILSFLINHTVVGNLIAGRDFGGAAGVAATSGVGPVVMKALRDAAIFRGPWEELVAEINEVDRPDAQVRFDQHFEWLPLVTDVGAGLTDMTCFGIDPALLPVEATVRPTLADGDEVLADVTDRVGLVAALLDVDPAPGLADLAYRVAGAEFFGCYIAYHPNPWQYDYQTFFVDTETGAGVLHTFHYVE